MTTFEVDVRSARRPDLAAFLRHALDAKLATADEVVRWADAVVLEEPTPPSWSLDLALCRNWPAQRISDVLADVASGAEEDVVRTLLAARLAGAVARGEIPELRAIELAWSLPLRKDTEPFDAVTWAVFATTECLEGVDEGWMAREKAVEIFRQAFGPFARHEWRAA